jgi:hypothetical protein
MPRQVDRWSLRRVTYRSSHVYAQRCNSGATAVQQRCNSVRPSWMIGPGVTSAVRRAGSSAAAARSSSAPRHGKPPLVRVQMRPRLRTRLRPRDASRPGTGPAACQGHSAGPRGTCRAPQHALLTSSWLSCLHSNRPVPAGPPHTVLGLEAMSSSRQHGMGSWQQEACVLDAAMCHQDKQHPLRASRRAARARRGMTLGKKWRYQHDRIR